MTKTKDDKIISKKKEQQKAETKLGKTNKKSTHKQHTCVMIKMQNTETI